MKEPENPTNEPTEMPAGQSSESDTSYEIEPELAIPDLPGSVQVAVNLEETLDLAAADLFVQSHQCVGEFGDFHLALSHGRIQERLIMKLMTDPKYRSIPWTNTHIWSTGELLVPADHPDHSLQHWRELLADAAGIPDEQFHAPVGSSLQSARDYSQELIEHLEWRQKGHDRLDYLLLDHDRSLIQGIPYAGDGLVGLIRDPDRVQMNSKLVNATRVVGVLGIGVQGRSLVEWVESQSRSDSTEFGLSLPAGVLKWYLDDYACSRTEELESF